MLKSMMWDLKISSTIQFSRGGKNKRWLKKERNPWQSHIGFHKQLQLGKKHLHSQRKHNRF